MYCPNCKEEFAGKFCPECGTMLVQKPNDGLNIGDGNAFNGNVSYDASHHVHNENKSVHNISNTTSTINNITQVAAQKSAEEYLQERKKLYFSACQRAYEDNILEQGELVYLETYRLELGLSKADADALLDKVRELANHNATKSELTGIAKIKLKQFADALNRNEVQTLMSLLDSLEALSGKFLNDELQYKYFLVLSALKPEECVGKFESFKADNYWKTYWSVLAYRKLGQITKSESVLMELDAFTTYPEDNVLLLGTACALMDGNSDIASDYLSGVVGDYSPDLQGLVDTLYLCVDPETAESLGTNEEKCAFYLENFFQNNLQYPSSDELDESLWHSLWKRYDCVYKVLHEGLAIVKSNEKCGYVDKTGREVIPCKYDEAFDFCEGLALVELDGMRGFIDKSGREVIPCKYDDASDFCEGLASVCIDEKYGYVNKTGREVIPFKYDDAFDFCEGLASVNLDGMLGLIDKTGREVIPCKYEYSNYSEFEFSEGLAPAEFDSKCGYVDKTGHEVIPCKYYLAYSFCEGLAHVVKMVAEKKKLFDVFLKNNGSTRHLVYKVVKDTYGLSMSEAINLVNNAPCKLKEGIDKEEASSLIKALEKAGAEVEIKISDCASDTFIEMEKHGYVDKTGCEVIPCIYDDVRSFSEGLAAVEHNGKWGYIDRTGREVIPFKYDDAADFSEGIASVKFEDKYGFIDKSGREVIPFKYDGAYKFKEGLVNVCLDHKFGFIDKSGREVIPCKYQQSWLDTFEGGLFEVIAPKNGDRFSIHMNHGVVDTAGREVVPCIYDEVSLDNKDGGFIKLTLDDETIYVDLQGNRLK